MDVRCVTRPLALLVLLAACVSGPPPSSTPAGAAVGSARCPDAAVPVATWKIVLHATGEGHFEALAFLMPQTAGLHAPPEKYLTSIDAIEEAAQLDFFAELPDAEETALEAATATVLWH